MGDCEFADSYACDSFRLSISLESLSNAHVVRATEGLLDLEF